MNQNEFINVRGEKCPDCKAPARMGTDPISILDGIVHKEWQCIKCKATWMTQYVIAGFSNFRKGKKK